MFQMLAWAVRGEIPWHRKDIRVALLSALTGAGLLVLCSVFLVLEVTVPITEVQNCQITHIWLSRAAESLGISLIAGTPCFNFMKEYKSEKSLDSPAVLTQ